MTKLKSIIEAAKKNEAAYAMLAPEVSDALERSLGLVTRTSPGISEDAFVDLVTLIQKHAGKRVAHAIMADFAELADQTASH
jgi:hypothetical protein